MKHRPSTLALILVATIPVASAAGLSEQRIKEEQVRCESFAKNKPAEERPRFVEQCLKTMLEPYQRDFGPKDQRILEVCGKAYPSDHRAQERCHAALGYRK